MVGKLMKYELKALFRGFLYVSILVLTMSLLTRIAMVFQSEVFSAIAGMFTYLGIVVLALCALIFSVERFYKSMFTGEGYMTFSLPASPSQILISKLLSALIVLAVSVVVSVGAGAIILSGIPAEEWESFMLIFGEIFNEVGVYFSIEPFIVVELVLYVLVQIPTALLYCYTVMSIGQLFTKGRKGISFAIYVGGNWIISLISSLVFMPVSAIVLAEFGPHAYFWLQIGVITVLNCAMFLFVRYIMLRKINLIV